MTSWGAKQDSIVFRIDRETPLSLERLTFGMMALGAEYERFVRKEYPKAADHEADLLVQRVTEGSIVIELIGAMQPLFQGMNNAVVFGQFVDLIGAKIGVLAAPRGRLEDTTVGELENLTRMAETVVGDSKGEAEIFAIEYQSETDERQVRAKVVWKAKAAEKVIENATSPSRRPSALSSCRPTAPNSTRWSASGSTCASASSRCASSTRPTPSSTPAVMPGCAWSPNRIGSGPSAPTPGSRRSRHRLAGMRGESSFRNLASCGWATHIQFAPGLRTRMSCVNARKRDPRPRMSAQGDLGHRASVHARGYSVARQVDPYRRVFCTR